MTPESVYRIALAEAAAADQAVRAADPSSASFVELVNRRTLAVAKAEALSGPAAKAAAVAEAARVAEEETQAQAAAQSLQDAQAAAEASAQALVDRLREIDLEVRARIYEHGKLLQAAGATGGAWPHPDDPSRWLTLNRIMAHAGVGGLTAPGMAEHAVLSALVR